MKTITEKQAARTRKVGVHRVEPTLYLRVFKTGSKSFVQKLVIGTRRVEIGLGGFPAVSFAEARKQATLNRAAVLMGNDPRSVKTIKADAFKPTFAEVNNETFTAKLEGWKGGANSSAATAWRSLMKNYALPKIGTTPIDKIGRDDVMLILSPLIQEKPAAGTELTVKMEAVFAHAVAAGHVSENVVTAIKPALPKRAAKKNHDALDWKDVPAALDAIRQTSSVSARLCLEWLILTAARSGEARGARWSEIDRESRTWTIPADRMKAGQEHIVPLSDAAMAVLDQAAEIREGDMIFPSARAGEMAALTIARLLKVAKIEGATIHGMRSSFRDWAADRGAVQEVAEACLAHSTGNSVELAYKRTTMIDRRRPLMESWGAYCDKKSAEVLKLTG